jgi:hypothetical protein
MTAESNDELPDDIDAGAAPPSMTFISGRVFVILIAAIGLLGAASAWLYLYDQQRVPREFWGFESPRIFMQAPTVTALLIKPEAPNVPQKKPYYDELYLVDAARYVVVKKVDISKREDLNALRRALIDHDSFDSGKKIFKEPEWRFGLIFEDDTTGLRYTASITFDSECLLGRPQSIDKTISTAPMSASLLRFFEDVFPEAKGMPIVTAPENYVDPAPEPVAQPAAKPNDLILPPDADVITLRSPRDAGGAQVAPSAVPANRGPVVVPTVPQVPFIQGARPASGIALPGGSPNAPAGGITLPAGSALEIPGAGPARPSPFSVGPSLDLSTPRSVTVPPLEGARPLAPPRN